MRRLALIAAVLLIAAGVWAIVAAGSSSSAGQYGSGSYQVRAIFDNAAFAVAGEDVRIAGAPVGQIASLSVTSSDQAAVRLSIDNPGFVPFHADATCAIRPQSLIAERYVDCNPGSSSAPPLALVKHGPGAGTYLLPVTQTSSPVDIDIVQDISQEPIRQRLSIILDELGTGLAARGADLGAVIRRADPALGYTDQVFKILAGQDKVLAALASDSATVLGPLANARRQIADFVLQADTTAVAAAQRSAEIAQSIRLLPSFLGKLKPLLADLGSLADQGTPLMSSLGQSAAGLDREFAEVVPFASAARRALIELGDAAAQAQGPLVASQSLATRLNNLGAAAQPSATLLDRLTASLDQSGAIQQLMGVLFYGTGATNGFDSDGHYVRTDALIGACTAFATTPASGCSANFGSAAGSNADSTDVEAQRASVAAAALSATPPGRETSSTASVRLPGTPTTTTTTTTTAAVAAVVRQALAASSGAGASSGPSNALEGLLGYLIGGSR